MNRTLVTMKQSVGKNIGDSSVAMLALIVDYLNFRLTEVLRRSNLLDTNRSDYTFSTVSGTEDYVLPQDFNKEISVVDKTNGIFLTRMDSQLNTIKNPSTLDTSGSVGSYIIMDKTVRNQPTSASVITFVSDSASDTSQSMYLKGYDANGYEDYETVTITGTTPVATSKTFIRVSQVAKSASTAGVITVTANSAAITVAILSREMITHKIKVMRLVSIPNTVMTIETQYIQKPLPMSQDYDYPIINCADVLEAGAESDAWRFKRQFAKAADLDIVFEKRLANLLFDNENQPNKVNKFNIQSYSYHSEYGS